MKKTIMTMGLSLMALTAQALTPAPGKEAVDKIFINAHIHVGNGKVLENAQLAMKDGKIVRAGYYKAPLTGNEIDLKGKHIYPGFILANTNLGLAEIDAVRASIDGQETGQLNPNVRSIVAYNTDSERIPTMRFNGILLAQTTPTGGLVSGTSSVVQLDAWNWEDAAVKMDDAMHVNWPAEWANRFDWSTFTMQLRQDKNYQQKVEQIKSLFSDAKADSSNNNIKLNAAKAVLAGKKNVFIHSNNPKAIIEAIRYFQALGVKHPVLVTSQGVEPIIDFIKAAGVGVILDSVHALPQTTDDSVDNAYALAAKLNEAGILTALSYPGSMSSRNLAFTAGTTVAYGNDKETALSMITLNVAKLLGIDKDYGSLELGKSATFFISEGDALDMRGNLIKEAYIDGRPIELHTRQQQLYERYQEKYQD
ncbi:amidohydrolase family protein [Marinicella sp. S1101]|uniref:amidohydrolase family protein n=1 Tax=Marinicella marina TaxID=2996016 RepID=UPI00226092BC|nr:amidohydrolase family protein [Marinicella marina]MCX7554718.1 amidohydrolase family protein [Marinicella marina]MDJ1141466.1 amidohydrolase family protein [Marinicella marina]